MKLLAVAHQVQPEEKTIGGKKEIFFNGPSPDEITLVDFAKNNGLVITVANETDYQVKILPESGLL